MLPYTAKPLTRVERGELMVKDIVLVVLGAAAGSTAIYVWICYGFCRAFNR